MPPDPTPLVRRLDAFGAEYRPEGHEGRPALSYCAVDGAQGVAALGWDDAQEDFAVPLYGTFPTPDEALEALNAHPPTKARWGRMVLP